MPTDNTTFAFTHTRLEGIKPPKTGRTSYRDTRVTGLSIVVTAKNSKSFYLIKRIDGAPTRIRIGSYPQVSIDEARQIAQKHIGDIANGRNPHQAKHAKTKAPTLEELFNYWLNSYAKIHKKTWKEDIRVFDKYCDAIKRKRLSLLTKTDIVQWHQNIGKRHGHYQANRAFQLVRSLFRVSDEIGYTGGNPCQKVRLFQEKSRERFLMPNELKMFHDAVMQEPPLWRDFLFVLLFTGQRKRNVCQMQWKDVDLSRGLWYVAGETVKNGDPLVVVLSTNALAILNERFNASDRNAEWVFPSERTSGSVVDAKKAWERVRERSGLTDVRMHDLRRTLGSWQALTGTSLQIIGKSLGHKSMKATEVYARLTYRSCP
jgi:integrase